MSQGPPPPYPDTKGFPPPQGYGPQYGQPGGQPGYGPPPGQYPPPAGGYGQPVQAPQPATIVVAQPVTTIVQTFREAPVHMRCPFCQADIVTATIYEVGGFTWLICVILCFFVGIFGLIPFCVDSCKDVVHRCPACNQQVGRFSRL